MERTEEATATPSHLAPPIYVLTIKLYKVCGKRSLTHFMGFPTDPTIKTALTGKSMIGELEEKERKK